MVMKALRKGAAGGITKFILFGFLVMAVGGLVMMDVGGFFRSGVARSDVGRAGKETISAASFDRTVQMTVQRIGMTPQDAYKVGYINQILSTEIRGRLLHQAAEDTGIVIGKKHVAQQISDIVAPMATDGRTPQEVLDQVLLNQGISERMFVQNMSRDMANSMLAGAIQGGLQSDSKNVAADMYRYQNEKRDIEYILFPDSDLKDLPDPQDEQLKKLYEAAKETYAKPETRKLKLITVKTDNLKDTLEISEEEIRQTYDDNIDMFSVEATRTLDQALLSTEDQAKAVRASVESGKNLKDAVQEATKSASGYVGEQDFTEDRLLEEIKDEVLAAEKSGAIVGPINTPLGWSVVVVKKINTAKTKAFDEVKKEIRDELAASRLSDEQYALAGTVDDLFAGGASLEDAAKEVDLAIADLPEMNQYGQNSEGKDALKDHETSRTQIIEAGFALEEGETSPIFESEDGKFQAVRAEKIQPKTYMPFEEVKESIRKQWMKDQTRITNQMRVAQVLASMGGNPNSIHDIAKANSKQVHSMSGVTRQEEPRVPLNQRAINNIFEAKVGMPISIDTEDGFAVVQVKSFSVPEKAEGKEFTDLLANLKKNNRDEGLILFMEQKRAQYGAAVNVDLLDQIYGTPPASN